MITIRKIIASLVLGAGLLLSTGQGHEARAESGKLCAVLCGGNPNLVINGDFSLNPVSASQSTFQNGWEWRNNSGTGTVAYTAGSPNIVTLTGDGTHVAQFGQPVSKTVAGRIYILAVTIGSSNVAVQAGSSFGSTALLNATGNIGVAQQFQITASAATIFITFGKTGAVGVTLANVSLRRK